MNALLPQAAPQAALSVRAGAAAVTARRAEDGTTRLADLRQDAPLRLLFPRGPAGEPLTACLTNTAGGLVGGDRLGVRAVAEEGAALLVMAQAAEKVYRSLGPDCVLSVDLEAADGAWLEWLPQETIIFDRARLRRRTRVSLTPGARLLAGEMLVFGRTAHGEVLREGLIRDAWEVRVGGRLAWADVLHLDGDLRAVLDHPATFDGATACATLVFHGPALEDTRDALREIAVPPGVLRGCTRVGGLLVARWLGKDALALRQDYARAWALVRERNGYAGRLPRLWHV